MRVIIMRGLPGSGKTTYVQGLLGRVDVCSADAYHIVDGQYKFDPKMSGVAHDKCFRRFLDIVNGEIDRTLVVDNTNTTLAEIAPTPGSARPSRSSSRSSGSTPTSWPPSSGTPTGCRSRRC